MAVPIFVITGFLDSGKTELLNTLLLQQGSKSARLLVLQFELGDAALRVPGALCVSRSFTPALTQEDPRRIASEIGNVIAEQKEPFAEIWVEWNGMLPFSLLEEVFLQPELKRYMRIEKVIHIADAPRLERLLAATGGILASQLAQSDLVVLKNAEDTAKTRRLKRTIRSYAAAAQITTKSGAPLMHQLVQTPLHPLTRAVLLIGGAGFLALAFAPHLESWGIPVNNIINAFLGMLLQALPFLLIGVLLSSAIQVFVPRESLEKRMPKSFVGGMLFMLLSGLILPVCDCASVPVFRSMVKKGVPVPLAVVFFAAAPVINPVVLLSTYYAFGGDWGMVFARVGLGVAVALALGVLLRLRPPKEEVLAQSGGAAVSCSCGCEEDFSQSPTAMQKLLSFLRHAQAEFFSVSQYLIIGALIASVIQTFSAALFTAGSGGGLVLSILVMMAMAFLLSLCSSSDAVVARGLSGVFPPGAIMAFLVFGPIFDIKNVLMLSAGFKKRFVLRLLLLSAVLVFAAVFVMYV